MFLVSEKAEYRVEEGERRAVLGFTSGQVYSNCASVLG